MKNSKSKRKEVEIENRQRTLDIKYYQFKIDIIYIVEVREIAIDRR